MKKIYYHFLFKNLYSSNQGKDVSYEEIIIKFTINSPKGLPTLSYIYILYVTK